MKRTLILYMLLLLGCLNLLASKKQYHFFTYVPYGQSLYADMHPNFVRLDLSACSNHYAYDFSQSNRNYRFYTHGDFGVNLPIWHDDFCNDRFGLSVSWAMSAQIWLDVLEPQTAPVVNTDYRIGLPSITFIHHLDKNFLHNYSIALSPFKHESTHIGDEMQIQRIEECYTLRRVNVSYNYGELLFTLNEPTNRYTSCHTFRVGLMLLLQPHEGWYSVKEEAGDGDASATHPRMSPWEAFLQYQYQSPCHRSGIQFVGSAEIRNRACYGYDLLQKLGDTPAAQQQDRRLFTYNLFAGIRYNLPGYDGIFSRFAVGLRAYYGNCPYGMFRSIDQYGQASLCLIFQ